jgi:hypothetical protein
VHFPDKFITRVFTDENRVVAFFKKSSANPGVVADEISYKAVVVAVFVVRIPFIVGIVAIEVLVIFVVISMILVVVVFFVFPLATTGKTFQGRNVVFCTAAPAERNRTQQSQTGCASRKEF